MTQEQQERMQEMAERIEDCFVRCGAVPQDINGRNREALDQRQAYLYRGVYFRVDRAEFDGEPFLIIDCIDDPRYASVGIMEDVDALPLTLTDEELEKRVRETLAAESGKKSRGV